MSNYNINLSRKDFNLLKKNGKQDTNYNNESKLKLVNNAKEKYF